jgi:hypothetical protein
MGMLDLLTEINEQVNINNELWRLIKDEWYSISDNEIELSLNCLDLRKDMTPPEEAISFNKVDCDSEHEEKICSLMEDLYEKLNIKDTYLFAGLIDQEAYKRVNRSKELIRFQQDRGVDDNHFGLYYLTEDDILLSKVKGIIKLLMEEKITTLIGNNAVFKEKNKELKSKKKELRKFRKNSNLK